MKTIDFPDICLVGGTGAGKSTAARLLEDLDFVRVAFAGVAEFPHYGSPRGIVGVLWGESAINDREKLIGIANEARRLDADVWLRNLISEMDQIKERGSYVRGHSVLRVDGPPRFVVDDCRFPNEFYGLKERGFVTVRVEADELSRIDRLKANGKWLDDEYLNHEIEHYLDDEPTDYTIMNDGSTDDLYDQIVEVLLRERKRR